MKISLTTARPKNAPFIRLVETEKGASPRDLSIGNRKGMTRKRLTIAIRKIIARAKDLKLRRIAIRFSDFAFPHLNVSNRDLAETLAINLLMANYEFVYYKTRPKEGWNTVQEVVLITKSGDKEAKERLDILETVIKGLNEGRSVRSQKTALDSFKEFQFLTAKPLLYVANTNENGAPEKIMKSLEEIAQKEKAGQEGLESHDF